MSIVYFLRTSSKVYDPEILHALGLPETMFPPLTAPGTVSGPLKPEIASEVGGQINVVCAPPMIPLVL